MNIIFFAELHLKLFIEKVSSILIWIPVGIFSTSSSFGVVVNMDDIMWKLVYKWGLESCFFCSLSLSLLIVFWWSFNYHLSSGILDADEKHTFLDTFSLIISYRIPPFFWFLESQDVYFSRISLYAAHSFEGMEILVRLMQILLLLCVTQSADWK